MSSGWWVQATVATITELQAEAGVTDVSLLNFVVSDGATLVATRYVSREECPAATMYYAQGALPPEGSWPSPVLSLGGSCMQCETAHWIKVREMRVHVKKPHGCTQQSACFQLSAQGQGGPAGASFERAEAVDGAAGDGGGGGSASSRPAVSAAGAGAGKAAHAPLRSDSTAEAGPVGGSPSVPAAGLQTSIAGATPPPLLRGSSAGAGNCASV